jgi:hypothetical protein
LIALSSIDRFRFVRRPQEEAAARASTARWAAQDLRAFTVLVRNMMFRRVEHAALRRNDRAHPGNRRGNDDSASAQQSASIHVTIVNR